MRLPKDGSFSDLCIYCCAAGKLQVGSNANDSRRSPWAPGLMNLDKTAGEEGFPCNAFGPSGLADRRLQPSRPPLRGESEYHLVHVSSSENQTSLPPSSPAP